MAKSSQIFEYFDVSAIANSDVNFKVKCQKCGEKQIMTYVSGSKKATSNFITHLKVGQYLTMISECNIILL